MFASGRTERAIKRQKLGRIPGVPRWRAWVLWSIAYPETRDLTRARDVEGLARRLREVTDPIGEKILSERALIATGLGLLKADSAVPVLAPLVQASTRLDVRHCAAKALRRIGGEEAARALRPALDDDAFAIKKAAIEVSMRPDPDIWPKLKELATSDPERLIRVSAVEALGRTQDDTWVPLLRSIAQTERWMVAVSAVHALATIGSPTSYEALCSLRSEGISNTIRLGLPRAVRHVRRLLDQ